MAVARTEDELRRVPSGARRAFGRLGEIALVAPIVAVMGLSVLIPAALVLRYSLTDWQPGYVSPWVGFDNFNELLHSSTFWQVVGNQGLLLLGVPLWVLLPLVISFTLYQGVRFAGVYRAIFFFPSTASPALLGILFTFILAPHGPLNSALRAGGLGALAHDWLAEDHLVKPVLIVILARTTLGMGVVIFSAALSALSPELFEAAEMDGAGWLQRLWHVVLPGLRRTVELWVVILVVTVFTGVFPWIYTLTHGGPGYSSTTLDWDIYQNALQYGNYGSAAAESVILLILVGIVVGIGAAFTRASRSNA